MRGEKGSVELLRGDYRVAASVDASNVSNYAGKETSDGGNYEVEYYIRSSLEPQRLFLPRVVSSFEQCPCKKSMPDYLR